MARVGRSHRMLCWQGGPLDCSHRRKRHENTSFPAKIAFEPICYAATPQEWLARLMSTKTLAYQHIHAHLKCYWGHKIGFLDTLHRIHFHAQRPFSDQSSINFERASSAVKRVRLTEWQVTTLLTVLTTKAHAFGRLEFWQHGLAGSWICVVFHIVFSTENPPPFMKKLSAGPTGALEL